MIRTESPGLPLEPLSGPQKNDCRYSHQAWYSSTGCPSDWYKFYRTALFVARMQQEPPWSSQSTYRWRCCWTVASTASTLINIFFWVNTQLVLWTVSHFVKQARWQILTVSPHWSHELTNLSWSTGAIPVYAIYILLRNCLEKNS